MKKDKNQKQNKSNSNTTSASTDNTNNNNSQSTSNQTNSEFIGSSSNTSKAKGFKTFKKFNYSNNKITDNTKLKEASSGKNISIHNHNNTIFFQLHENVIPSDFNILLQELKTQKTEKKNFTVKKKVTPESIRILIDYFYTGKITDVDEDQIMSLAALVDCLGSNHPLFTEISNHLANQSFDDDGETSSKELSKSALGSGKVSFVVGIGITLLVFVYVYFDKVVSLLENENTKLTEQLEKYKVKYDDLVAANRNKNQQSAEEQMENSLYKNHEKENTEEVKQLSQRLKELRQELQNQEKSALNEEFQSSTLKGYIEKLHKKINKTQELANAEYLNELKKVRKEKKAELKMSDFKYYYHYNETIRSRINTYINTPDCSFPDVYKGFDDVTKKSLAYMDFDFNDKENSILDETSKGILETKNNWENYIKSKESEISEVRRIAIAPSKEKLRFIELLKEIKLAKSKIKSHLKNVLGYSFEFKDYYNLIYEAFGKRNFNFKQIFNSNKLDSLDVIVDELKRNVFNQRNLLFYVQTQDDRLLGGFSSIKFPEISSMEDNTEMFLADPNSFLFDFKAKDNNFHEVFKAFQFFKVHFYVKYLDSKQFVFGFGNNKNDEGLSFRFKYSLDTDLEPLIMASWGKRPIGFDIPKNNTKLQFNLDTFGSANNRIKVFKIYQINFLE